MQAPRNHAVRHCRWLPAFAALILPLGHAWAQSEIPAQALRRCAQISRGVERLACYDALAADPAGDAPVAARAADPNADAPGEPRPDVDAFGAEQVEGEAAAAPEQIQSRLVGEFTGWRGNTEFRLENGQVWRQAGSGRLAWSADSPIVTIRRGVLNSYRLSVEGLNASVRVRRVR